jgi:hypothetical protein
MFILKLTSRTTFGTAVPFLAVAFLYSFILCSCVYVPLPDQAPPLQEVRLPQPGDSESKVRNIFGRPQVLDSGRFLVYDWTTDRAFVIVGLAQGLAGATITAKQQFRMIVELNDSQQVARVDCSASKLTERELDQIGCVSMSKIPAVDPRSVWREVAAIPGLPDSKFWHPELAGSNTNMVLSANGGVLVASDVDHKTWIIDVENFAVMDQVIGIEPNFWSLKGVAEPRAAFDSDGRKLLIAQGNTVTLLERTRQGYVPEGDLNGLDLKAVRYTCCPDYLMGIGPGGVTRIAPDGEVLEQIEGEGRLDFGAAGVSISQASPEGTFRVAVLSSKSLTPSLRAVFGQHGAGNVVLDGRNDFARHRSPVNFEFSPGGRWLVRNSCRHLELWDAGQLLDRLSGQSDGAIFPLQSMIMALSERAEDDRECHGPIAFSPDGTKVAAASKSAIHIWDIETGRQELWLGVETEAVHKHVVTMAFAGDRQFKAVVSDTRGNIYLVSWEFRP